MKKKYFMLAMALAATSLGVKADNVAVVYLDGETSKTYTLSYAEISKIELSGTTVNIVPVSGATQSFAKSAVEKIDFHASTAGIHAATKTGSDITVRTNGYAVTVAGLADNAEVKVYNTAGQLLGTAVAKNGTATLDATKFSGTTLVKAADKTIKFIKK